MATLNISLTDAMKSWISAQISTGQYANASDYIRDLVRHDQRQCEEIRIALIEAEQGGISKRKVADIVKDAKVRLNA